MHQAYKIPKLYMQVNPPNHAPIPFSAQKELQQKQTPLNTLQSMLLPRRYDHSPINDFLIDLEISRQQNNFLLTIMMMDRDLRVGLHTDDKLQLSRLAVR